MYVVYLKIVPNSFEELAFFMHRSHVKQATHTSYYKYYVTITPPQILATMLHSMHSSLYARLLC